MLLPATRITEFSYKMVVPLCDCSPCDKLRKSNNHRHFQVSQYIAKHSLVESKFRSVNFDLSQNLIVSYDPKAVALAQPLSSQSKSSAIERANEVQASLLYELPSFVKLMLPSHVTGCLVLLTIECIPIMWPSEMH
ncbi:hypothetical protein Tco_0594882 [Tanacetum coccineum]